MKKPRVFMGTAVLVLTTAIACNRTQTSREADRAAAEVRSAAEQAKDVAAEAGEKLADGWLTAKIQAQFFADDDIKSRYINVTSRDGVVKLKGFVESDDARRQVLEITRNTDGVKQVDDKQLLVGRPVKEFDVAASEPIPSIPSPVPTTGVAPSVVPAPAPMPTDDSTVVSLVQAKYFLDPTIKTRHIEVRASNGVVTLQGSIASENERSQALLLARSTPGVQRVEDALTVDPGLQ